MAHGNAHSHQYNHQNDGATQSTLGRFAVYTPAFISLVLLASGLLLNRHHWFTQWVEWIWYAAAYAPVGIPVLRQAFQRIRRADVFNEFFLMSLATIGAFAIGEYPEGVAVMLFYAIGELFQQAAIDRARRNIKALLDLRPESAIVLRNGIFEQIDPTEVEVGETIQVLPGGRVALDGVLISDRASFNTSALTGESIPRTIGKGEQVLAGMLDLSGVITIEVTKRFEDSSLAKILDLVQNATKRKAKTERFIYRFAKVYTPIVVVLAALLIVVPYFVVSEYQFDTWLYRALVFLVISCPCALVISIPLGYFGGIGAASRHGILFKGSNYLDRITRMNTIVLDKTGTLTKGVFEVQEVITDGFPEAGLIQYTASLERYSTHPIAVAIMSYAGTRTTPLDVSDTQEFPGHGLRGLIDGQEVLAGNLKLLDKFKVPYPTVLGEIPDTIVVVAINGVYAGYITIADTLKSDASDAIQDLRKAGIKEIWMLSGDKDVVTQRVAAKLGLNQAFGGLLPEQKVEKLEQLKSDPDRVVGFVGDGINDAPALAIADVGIAMGGLGTDLAIETADVVIQTDQPSKIAIAKRIGHATNAVVWQNIAMSFGVKVLVLALGAGGLAGMWEAVFADVGVALLAILNAVRVQRIDFT